MNLSSKKKILIWVVLFLIIDIAIIAIISMKDDSAPFRDFENLESYIKGEFSSSLKEKGLIIRSESTDGTLTVRYSKGYGKNWLKKVIKQSLSSSGLKSDFDWKVKNGFNIKLTHPADGDRTLEFRTDDKMISGLI